MAICLIDTKVLIGGCGIRREAQESRVANLGWAINPDFQGNGYATEAASALIRLGFESLKVGLIYATCDSRNKAFYRVMEKLKMNRVGLLKNARLQKGIMRDIFRYEIEPLILS